MAEREIEDRIVVAANVVLLSACFVAVASLVYVVLRQGLYPGGGGLGFIILSSGIAILCLVTLLVPKKIRCNVALALFCSVLSVYAVEIILFFCGEALLGRPAMARAFGKQFDTRPLWRVIDDLKREGIEAYPMIGGSTFVESDGVPGAFPPLFPLAGISLRTAVSANDRGEWQVFRTDEHGFANPGVSWDDAPTDVALIGDSLAFGLGVPLEQGICGHLRKKLPELRILSLAIHGSGPLCNLAVLREYGSVLRPRVVLWLGFANDMQDLYFEERSPTLKKYLAEKFTQNLVTRQFEIDNALSRYCRSKAGGGTQFLGNLFRIARLQSIRKYCRLNEGLGMSIEPVPNFELFHRIMAIAARETSSWGGKVYFVYLPDIRVYATGTGVAMGADERLLAALNKAEIRGIDFTEVVKNHPDPLSLLPFRREMHYSAEGYELVAEFIKTNLLKPAGQPDQR